MKTVKFLLMGNKNVGKSTLLDTYLWKLKYGCAYHDHTEEQVRYLIDIIDFNTVEQLREHLALDLVSRNIFCVCFNVADKNTLKQAREVWIYELLKLKPSSRIFLIGLQCDLREQFVMKLKNDCVYYSDGVSISRYYENVHYMECSKDDLDSICDIFDTALKMVLYEKDLSGSEKIIEFYEKFPIKFKFKECECKSKCDSCHC